MISKLLINEKCDQKFEGHSYIVQQYFRNLGGGQLYSCVSPGSNCQNTPTLKYTLIQFNTPGNILPQIFERDSYFTSIIL